jgi:CheY-like chemotaxis protein
MAHSPKARSEVLAVSLESSGKTVRILLVDDDEDLREIMREMLERIGFAGLASANGADALRIVGDYPGFIDLLLTDIQMPKMAGPELAQRAKLLRPRLKILFVSGDAIPALASGLLDPDAMILPKPFSQGTLAARVDSALRE